MTRILHYIPEIKEKDIISDSVTSLVSLLKEKEEVKLMTQAEKLQVVLKEYKPEIIHLHICWDYDAYKLYKQIQSSGIAWIVSLHGELEPYTMRNERYMEKRYKEVLYFKQMIQTADATIVSSISEQENLTKLGWTNRICTIPSYLLDSSISIGEVVEQTLLLYRKVIDTRYHILMSEEEKYAICALLNACVSQNVKWKVLSSDQILNLRSLNPSQWQRIMLYASDEDILEEIMKGIGIVQLDTPYINVDSISRFPRPLQKAKGQLLTKEMSLKTSSLNNLTQKEEKDLRQLAMKLMAAQKYVQHKQFSMRHLMELYKEMLFGDYDEDRLVAILKGLRLKTFTARILQLLKDYFSLSEGFLPFEAINDKDTQMIRNMIL